MKDQSTYNWFKDMVDYNLNLLWQADTNFIKCIRDCASEIIEDKLIRKMTLATSNRDFKRWTDQYQSIFANPHKFESDFKTHDQRIAEALEKGHTLIHIMNIKEIESYLKDCHNLGLEETNRRYEIRINWRTLEDHSVLSTDHSIYSKGRWYF